MPNINIGIQKENDVIELLNNKYIKDLDNNARFFIERLFDKLDDSESIICERVEGFVKPDFFIKYKKKTKYISMKSGKSSVVHQEDIKKFLNFLREYNVSKRTLQTILYFQFGDGTMDGTGKRRWSYEETVFILKERIKEANDELNSNKDLVIAITERALFQGTSVDYPKATYIYHGDKDYGIVVSERQIIKHVKNRDWKFVHNLHIGPFHLKPHARYADKEIKDPTSRYKVDLNWVGLIEDLKYIGQRYND